MDDMEDSTTNIELNGNSTSSEDLFHQYPVYLTQIASLCCILFILFGIPGNLLTIVALARCKKVRNATAYFIVNLSTCDLMSCCFNLPLAASMFYNRRWVHGDTLCILFPFFRYGLMACSIFTVLAITINRFVMIAHPHLYQRVYRTRYLVVKILLIWLGAFGALIPTLLGVWGKFGLDTEIGSCSILNDENGHTPKAFLFLVAFVLPCCSIVLCYARIFFIVRKAALNSRSGSNQGQTQETDQSAEQAILRRSSGRPSMAVIHIKGKMTGKDKKLLMMIFVIFFTFVICYLPITVIKALVTTKNNPVNIFVYILIYLTTCMNPIIYVVMSSEYRQAYKSLFICNKDWLLSSRSNNSNKT